MKAPPTYFVSHGGGPWPWMKEQSGHTYDKLEASIQDIGRQIGVRPKAVLMVSGHWEEAEFSISSGAQPGMIYDYSGFPPHTYQIKYAAPGSPELAARVQQLLQAAGHKARLDPERGFDHGTFTVMQTLYPEANIPVVQMSLQRAYDPETHIDAGRALAPLREQGVLILGSGLSYHNLRQFGPDGAIASKAFDQWLQQTLLQSTPDERIKKLLHWADAPMAKQAHPREDHLMPLHVAVGAAQNEAGVCVYHEDDFFGGLTASSFKFGG
jgi:aromatic ring-opening dioxygenase catalytic subunit (LigB family)